MGWLNGNSAAAPAVANTQPPADLDAWLQSLGTSPTSGATAPAPQAAPAVNAMQQDSLAPSGAQPDDPNAFGTPQAAPMVNAMQPAAVDPAVAQAVADGPRKRHSLVDIIGGLADAVATAGGAAPQYQPNVDARTTRANAAADHIISTRLSQQKITSNDMDNMAQDNKAVGSALKYVQAIKKANPAADTAATFQTAAQMFGVQPDHAKAIGEAVTRDPGALDGFSAALDPEKKDNPKYGGNVVYAKDANGKLAAFQVGLGAEGARSALPDGFTPVDPLHFVDSGGSQVGVGTRSGEIGTTIDKTIDPNKAADRTSRETVAAGHDRTAITTTGMRDTTSTANTGATIRGRQALQDSKPAKAGTPGGADAYTGYKSARDQLVDLYHGLDGIEKDPNLHAATGYIAGAIPSPAQKNFQARVLQVTGKSVPAAVSLLKSSGLTRAAQMEVMATAKGLTSDLPLYQQSSDNYIARVRSGKADILAKINAMDENARRTGVRATVAPAAGPARTTPPGVRIAAPAPKLTVSNW